MALKFKPFKKTKVEVRRPTNEIGRPRPAFSYYAGDGPKIDTVKKRQRNEQKHTFVKKVRLVPSLIAIAVIIVSLFFNTTLTQSAATKFVGDPSPYRSVNGYAEGIQKVLSSSVWNGNKLTINIHTTELALLRAFPELDAVNVALPIVGRRPTVTMHARTPSLLLTTSTKAFVIDSSGKIVAEPSQLISSQREKLQIVEDKSGLVLRAGDQALQASTVSFIVAIKAQLVAKQLEITQITLPTVPNEVDIKIKDQKYYIKTDSTGDARVQIGGYLATKNDGVEPVEYIDVRIEEKVFFK